MTSLGDTFVFHGYVACFFSGSFEFRFKVDIVWRYLIILPQEILANFLDAFSDLYRLVHVSIKCDPQWTILMSLLETAAARLGPSPLLGIMSPPGASETGFDSDSLAWSRTTGRKQRPSGSLYPLFRLLQLSLCLPQIQRLDHLPCCLYLFPGCFMFDHLTRCRHIGSQASGWYCTFCFVFCVC